jgi:hypothetical protein
MDFNYEKIKIKAPGQLGWVEVVYLNNTMIAIDTTHCIQVRKTWFFEKVPIDFSVIKDFVAHYRARNVEIIPCDISFDEFWEAYNYKINAKRCETLWKKMSRKKRIAAYYRLFEYELYRTNKTPVPAKLSPEYYLKNERYYDEAY